MNKIIRKTSDLTFDRCFICEKALEQPTFFEAYAKLCLSKYCVVFYPSDEYIRVNIDNYCFFYYTITNQLHIYNRKADNRYPNHLIYSVIYSGEVIELDFSDLSKLEEKLHKLVIFYN